MDKMPLRPSSPSIPSPPVTKASMKISFRTQASETIVGSVPPEIMLHIFKNLWALPTWSNRKERWDWLAITGTCRRWRNIAISATSLWTNIRYLHNSDMVRAFFERSGSSCLTLELTDKSGFVHSSPELVEMIVPHLQRVREMKVELKRTTVWRLFETMMSRSTSLSNLRILSLHEPENHFVESLAFKFTLMQSPLQIHELDLRCIHIPFDSTMFHGLRKLSIDTLFTRHHSVPLLDILDNSQEIRSLSIHRVKLSPLSAATDEGRLVYLPHLEDLSIKRISFEICFEALSHLVIQHPINFAISYINYRLDNFKALIPDSIGQCIPTTEDGVGLYIARGRLRVDLDFDQSQSIELVFQDMFTGPEDDDNDGEVELAPRYSTATIFRSVPNILKQPYLRDKIVTVLTVNLFFSYMGAYRAIWIELFRHLPTIECLNITFDEFDPELSSNHFVYAFVEPMFSEPVTHVVDINPTESRQLQFCWPNLTDLYLQSFSPSSEDIYNQFVECMKARAECGLSLCQLSICVEALRFGNREEEKQKLEASGIADQISILED